MTIDEETIKMETEEVDLKSLIDSKYPLLQEFREKCPGSYKHSQYLESMIEGVSTELGLDVDVMRVVALYHDIGKMFNPSFFTENQAEDNIHDKLDPWVSYELITRHVSDSVMLLINDSNFPRQVVEIISQHQGDSVVKYFFVKSKEEVDGGYRYKTTKPTTVESAVLMICDHVEAISRSHVNANKFDAEGVINKTISDLIDDGQLDEVTMKLGDLTKIKKALSKELQGMNQKRVDYPEREDEEKIA